MLRGGLRGEVDLKKPIKGSDRNTPIERSTTLIEQSQFMFKPPVPKQCITECFFLGYAQEWHPCCCVLQTT